MAQPTPIELAAGGQFNLYMVPRFKNGLDLTTFTIQTGNLQEAAGIAIDWQWGPNTEREGYKAVQAYRAAFFDDETSIGAWLDRNLTWPQDNAGGGNAGGGDVPAGGGGDVPSGGGGVAGGDEPAGGGGDVPSGGGGVAGGGGDLPPAPAPIPTAPKKKSKVAAYLLGGLGVALTLGALLAPASTTPKKKKKKRRR